MIKVCMFVFNSCENDSRVLKEAKTLVEAGYSVKILALFRTGTKRTEERDGFLIKRIKIDSFDIRFSKQIKTLFQDLKKTHLTVKNYIKKFSYTGNKKIKNMIYKKSKFKSFTQKNIRRTHSFLKSLLQVLPAIRPPYVQRKVRKGVRQMFGQDPVQFLIFGWISFLVYLSLLYIVTSFAYLGRMFYETFEFLLTYFSAYLRTGHLFFSYWDYYQKCLKMIEKDPSDIYHAHDFNTLFPAYLAKKRTRGKLIYDSHELYAERNRPRKQSWFMKQTILRMESFLIKRADYTVTVSRPIAEVLKRRNGIEKVGVVMNVPDVPKARIKRSLRKALNIPSDKKIILYVGSFTFNRGLEELIQSLSLLEDCVLVLMGYSQDQQYFRKLKDLVRSNGISQRIFFFGPVASEEVIDYSASADIGVAPIKNAGLSYYYCLPNKLFEYLSAGIPVVGSWFPELRKVINGFRVGETFDPESPMEIAESIKSVLQDPEKYKRMTQKTRQAAKVFNWQRESRKLLGIYNQLETKRT
jgi:glycosyltransferase involved in cell wall biosynthesis